MAKISPLWQYVSSDIGNPSVMPYGIQTQLTKVAEDCPYFHIGKHPKLGYFAILSEEGPLLWAEHPNEMYAIHDAKPPELLSRYEILTESNTKKDDKKSEPPKEKITRKIRWK